MRAVIQRVSRAEVRVGGSRVGAIDRGLLVYLAVAKADTEADLTWLMDKIIHLRIFPNDESKFDRSLLDISGQVLLISQFTLYGDCRKGRRPGFDQSAAPEPAQLLYHKAAEYLRAQHIPTETGIFGAKMEVESINDGPVTFILDSPAFQ